MIAKWQRRRHDGVRIGEYHCTECGDWHTGSRRKRRRLR